MTMDFTRFGVPLDIKPPPAGDTFDATDQARQSINSLGGTAG
jgi:hypothetical protein